MKRSFLSAILSFFIVISMVLPVSAAAGNLTLEEKADVLKELTILRGSDNGYNLDKQLERSEAAAFIVRIMGKENYVNANKDKYKVTKFPDVPSSQWYAPYIGYCYENKIINGYENGNFGPGDYIDERSFLKLMLGVLGYEMDVDFTWAEVYDKAYEIGLIDKEVFERRNNTTRKYLRGDVVEVLYSSLKLPHKTDNVSVVQNLVNEGIITLSKAEELGLIENPVETAIENIQVLSGNWIVVKLNQSVYNVNNEDVKIYETEDFTKTLTVEIISQTSNELVIKTGNQIPGKSYTLEMYNVTNTRGEVTEVLSHTFEGFRDPNLKSDFFRISKVEPVNRSMVNVYFTHPVNANSEIITNYEIFEGDELFAGGIYKDIMVTTMNSADNGITIYLKTKTFKKDVEYRLNISGKLTSAYGVTLNEGEGEAITFKGKDDASEDFRVVSVQALSSTRVEVEFSREVDPGFAQKFVNYVVLGSNMEIPVNKAVLGGEGSKKGKVVYLTLGFPLDKKQHYTLRIEFITDVFRQSYLEKVEYKFSGAYLSVSALNLSQVWSEDAGTVCVTFNKSVDESTALNKYYYVVRGVTDTNYSAIPEKVYYEESGGKHVLKLYLPADKQMVSGNRYKLTVLSAVKDKMGDSPEKNLEYTFTGTNFGNVKPTISRAVIISKDSVKVEFSKEISADIPNLLVSNYILQYTDGGTLVSKHPLSLVYADPRTIILKFDELDYYTDYTLKFNELKDYSGQHTRTASDGQNSVNVTIGS